MNADELKLYAHCMEWDTGLEVSQQRKKRIMSRVERGCTVSSSEAMK